MAAGSHDEPPSYPGLAHFLEPLLFLGSRGYPRDEGLMAFVQRHGGLVNASTQARHTDFVFELPAEHLSAALTRLLDMLSRPLLEADAQVREREVLHAEYQARSQDADSRIDHALGQALAAGHRCSEFWLATAARWSWNLRRFSGHCTIIASATIRLGICA